MTTSSVTAPGAATAGLVERQDAVRRADDRVRELELEMLGARRSVERAMGPLREYYDRVGAGDREPDPELEARLREAVTSAQADVVLRPSTAHGRMLGMEPVNVRVEALLAGARRAAEQAREDLERFAAERFDELAAERLPRSRAVGERGRRLLVALLEWQELRAGEVRYWQWLCRLAGAPADLVRSPVELPDSWPSDVLRRRHVGPARRRRL